MADRTYTSRYLCDLTVPRIGVVCDRCGMVRSYDRLKLIARLEEFDHQCLPALINRLARAEGCERATPGNYNNPCGLVYDAATIGEKP